MRTITVAALAFAFLACQQREAVPVPAKSPVAASVKPAPPPPETPRAKISPLALLSPAVEGDEASGSLPLRFRRRPSSPPSPPPVVCTDEERATAARYATADGYGYLETRCELIRAWRQDGGDVVMWLAEHGRDSPAADCDNEFTVDRAAHPESRGATVLLVAYHGQDYRSAIDPDENVTVHFAMPCYATDAESAWAVSLGVSHVINQK